ncbi:unnamed protein product [Pedinophyceae sp. YPF-701]|nr:unnamed protein product [Pedinophyceae sp. YPF-701]
MAAVQDLSAALAASQSVNQQERQQAEAYLAQFRESDFASFVLSSAAELSLDARPEASRQAAGLLLKNSLDARDQAEKDGKWQRWKELQPEVRSQVKAGLLQTLGAPTSPRTTRRVAGQAIALIAAIELSQRQWPELIPMLLEGCNANDLQTRIAALHTVGFLFEELDQLEDTGDVPSPEEVDKLLQAMCGSTSSDNPEVASAAIAALQNSAPFAKANFERQNERDFIMSVVCNGCTSPHEEVRRNSFECLSTIADFYYKWMPSYIQAMYSLSVKAVREDEEDVALQALELWCNIAETEADAIDDDAMESHDFVKKAAPELVPMFLEQLLKQDEGEQMSETAWNLSVAAAVCLWSMSPVVGDPIVEMVMPFIQANIGKNAGPEDWRFREAATLAFGSVLDGPGEQTLRGLVQSALPFLLNAATADPHPLVKDTTCWAIGRIFDLVHSPRSNVVTPELVPQIVHVLRANLAAEESLAKRCCYAAAKFVAGYEGESGTPVAACLKDLLEALLGVISRSDVGSNLVVDAFESVNEVVDAVPRECLDLLKVLHQDMIAKLQATFAMPTNTPDARERQVELQGMVCGTLQSIVARVCLESEDDPQRKEFEMAADTVMENLLRVFQCHGDSVHYEALLAATQLLDLVKHGFDKYMPHFMPWLLRALESYTESDTLKVAINTAGHLAMELKSNIMTSCDQIMTSMLTALQRRDVHRGIKPIILSTFGDIAMSIENDFERYLPEVLRMLGSAAQLSGTIAAQAVNDEDMAEYNDELRSGLFEAYAGIIHGLDPSHATAAMGPHLPQVLQFIGLVASDDRKGEQVTIAAANLLGDIAQAIGNVGQLFQASAQAWAPLVQQCKALGTQGSGEVAKDARNAAQHADLRIQSALRAVGSV